METTFFRIIGTDYSGDAKSIVEILEVPEDTIEFFLRQTRRLHPDATLTLHRVTPEGDDLLKVSDFI